MIYPARDLEEAAVLAQAIVNTIREPLLVLDAEFRVLAASRSFYDTFRVVREQTQGCLLYALGDGQWDIPSLRLLLETIIPDRVAMDDFEVDHDFPKIGRRIMLLNARKVRYEKSDAITLLLAFEDITARRLVEQEKEALLKQSQQLLRENRVLLEEMRHRVANSLQIIASILLLKAKAVSSEETRHHLRDAHQRVMSVAAVQQHLHTVKGIESVEVSVYLEQLCAGLAASMVGEDHPVDIRVISESSAIASATAVSLGLIVTELVINALKYAFPLPGTDTIILVTYEVEGENWRLVIADNGTGKLGAEPISTSTGLGTTIINALAQQLGATVAQTSGNNGLSVSVIRGLLKSHMPCAA